MALASDQSIFASSGVNPVLGRTFAEDEDQLGKERVAVLSHRVWETRFGADPNIVGRKIVLDGLPHEVIGVLPADAFSIRRTPRSGVRWRVSLPISHAIFIGWAPSRA
jgi:hypothetical protein